MQPQFSPQSQQGVARAKQLAAEGGSGVAGEAHLFLSLLELSDAADTMIAPLLALSGISREEARLYAQSAVEIVPMVAGKTPRLSRGARKILLGAAFRARFGFDFTPRIEPHHILIACTDARGRVSSPLLPVLRSLGLDAARLRQHLRELKARQNAQSASRFTGRAEKALEAAHAAMRASFCGRISATHLLLGVLMSGENIATETLAKAGCDLEALRTQARDSIKNDGQIATHEKRFSPGAKRALERAARAAKAAGHRHIDCGYLLQGLLPARQTLGEGWRARGRELDSVDELWTAEQVAALRGELGNVTTPQTARIKSKSGSGSSSVWISASFLAALLWDFYLLHIPHAHNLWIVVWVTVLLLLLGIGIVAIFVAMIYRKLPSAFRLSLSALFGWLLGAALGAFLYQIVLSKPL